jgi:hypothetical protein
MYLYATTVRPGAVNPNKVIDWAVRLTQKINQISEVPSTLWTAVMSPGAGSLSWTSVVEDLGVIEDTETKLAADPGYNDLVAEGIPLLSTDGLDQRLLQLVFADADSANIVPQYASTVQAQLAPGSMISGIGLGVDLAQRVKAITGRPTSFAVASTGGYGDVMWVSLAETIQQVQAANEALNADADFGRVVDEQASNAYLPGATQTVSRKII